MSRTTESSQNHHRITNRTDMEKFVEIDGSVLEGGGQILRMAVSLSALAGVPVLISKIRAGRAKPGLAAQHLKGIELVASMCGARVDGATLGSTRISFAPGRLRGGRYLADTHTAGSISLLLQVALPCALLADGPVELQLKGGTNADMAPQIDYTTEVFRRNLERFGATFDLDLHRRGYFPKGGGHVTVTVAPVRAFKPVNMTEQGRVERIGGWSFVAGSLPLKLAHQMSEGAKNAFKATFGSVSANIDCYQETREVAPNNCNGIVLVCETSSGCVLGGSALGRRGADAADVGRQAGEELRCAYTCGACVDTYTQDQLIIYMALAHGKSCVRVGEVTLHTKTAIYIAELLTKCKFSVVPSSDGDVIECAGAAYTNSNVAGR